MNDEQETGQTKEKTITLERRLVDQLEDLAQEVLSAIQTTNAGADEPIYTDSSLSAAYAILEELRSVLVIPATATTPGKDTTTEEPLNAAPAVVGHLQCLVVGHTLVGKCVAAKCSRLKGRTL